MTRLLRFTKTGLAAITSVTMAVATFPQVVYGVLAPHLIDTFQVSRWQIGILVAGTGLVGGLLAPHLGRFTDRIGALHSTRVVLGLAFLSLFLIAISPTYVMMVVAALLSGAPQGWSNPATNTLIAGELPSGGRGVITGIKQSGVQAGAFAGGLLLPMIAAAANWRVAVASFLVIPLTGLMTTLGKRSNARTNSSTRQASRQLPPLIRLVSIYGVLAGAGTSAMLTFLPLFASEDQEWRIIHAGWLVAGVGLVGVVARIFWARTAEMHLGYGRAMETISILTMGSVALLALSAGDAVPSWSMSIAAVLLGVGAVSWNSVGMLAVMERSPADLIGRGTGVVLFGFLLGYGIGAPLFGWTVDRLGSYLPGWLGVAAVFVAGFGVATRVTRLEAKSLI